MSSQEAAAAEGLPQYRQIDPLIAFGAIPLAHCLKLQAEIGDPAKLPPDAQGDAAWLQLETVLAMPGQVNPANNKVFTPKDINMVATSVKTSFQEIAQNEQAPPSLRARAVLAVGGVALYRETRYRQGSKAQSPGTSSRVVYLHALQDAAKILLAEHEHSPKDIAFMQSMVAMAALTEFDWSNGRYILASSRQPWHINAYSSQQLRSIPVVISQTSIGENVLDISPSNLGHAAFGDPNEPLDTLRAYVQMQVGFARTKSRATMSSPAFKGLEAVTDRILAIFIARGRKLKDPEPVPVAAQEETVAAPESPPEDLMPSAKWYLMQPANIRDISAPTLSEKIAQLEGARSQGELPAANLHTLGWMKMDYGHILSLRVQRQQVAVWQMQERAGNLVGFEAEAHEARVRRAYENLDTLRAETEQLFDGAQELFRAAGERKAALAPADTFRLLLDEVAAPLYKALFLGASPEEFAATVNTYNRKLANLYLQLRNSERTLKSGSEQLRALHGVGFRMTLCLLLSAVSDEALRHLTLPTGMRADSDKDGELDVVIFPYDSDLDGHNTNTPVQVRFVHGNSIEVSRRHLTIGRDLLVRGQPLSLLSKLSSVVRTVDGRKKETRGEAIDDLTFRIADAVSDAVEFA